MKVKQSHNYYSAMNKFHHLVIYWMRALNASSDSRKVFTFSFRFILLFSETSIHIYIE